MGNYELKADEVVLYEGEVKSQLYSDNTYFRRRTPMTR